MRLLGWLTPAVIMAALLGPPLLVGAGLATMNSQGGSGGWLPSDEALADIPPDYLVLYQAAPATWCPGLGWPVLAAIGKVETDHGRSPLPGVREGANEAGAAGPMQFGIGGRAGNTWGGAPIRGVPPDIRYGVDGNGDGIADVYDPADAIPAAAGYLCDHGAPDDLEAALYAYNRSPVYVRKVLEVAARYGIPTSGLLLGGDIVCPVLPPVQFTDTWHAPRSGGRLHMGQDLFATPGQPLLAVADGTITSTAVNSGLGGTILWLETDDGAAWYYAHLSGFAPGITRGIRVHQGQVVGYNGNTGNAASTAAHLHIQYRPAGRNGPDVNPYQLLSAACPGHR